ncbi:MAG: AAA family ATPase [Xenococcaceae cyanobacterium MO_188.B32]|nr:AAA family ATPase [Xenococcaceae cyanobacterium MO_188.B32]
MNLGAENLRLSVKAQKKLDNFKEYAVSHSQLAKVDRELMRAIREPAGFAHVLIYRPSGVGKTTMIRQITRRLNELSPSQNAVKSIAHSQDTLPPLPLLLLETRPPDGGAFNRANYYRTALKLLGEPFYERRMLVNIDSEQVWEKKGRGRTKAAQFNDSPELRHALEAAMNRRGVQAVILDEAQHLMKLGSGSSAGKLLDQLDWIKSMTNVTGVVHILIGTYELLSFRNLSGQASRRGLDLHFPRYQFQHEPDRQAFQGVLLALLKQVPLQVEIETLMQHWVYFYERSIGCVGVLKDWLIRAVAAALDDGSETLTLEYLQDHALSLAQCERMALDATEGEQELRYAESRREPLWQLLQAGMDASAIPAAVESAVPAVTEAMSNLSPPAEATPKTTRRKRTAKTQDKETTPPKAEIAEKPPRKKQQTRKKTSTAAQQAEETSLAQTNPLVEAQSSSKEAESLEKPARKKRQTRKKTLATAEQAESLTSMSEAEVVFPAESAEKPTRKKRQTPKKSPVVAQTPDPSSSVIEATDQQTDLTAEETPPQKKRTRRVGQRTPKRDPVGS